MMTTTLLGLENKVAIVTGGGGNIGGATVRMLAQAGARVIAADIVGDDAEAVAAAARAVGGIAIAVTADTRRVVDIERVVRTALDTWGRLDVGVNVVGGGVTDSPVLDAPDAAWESTMETNLYSSVRCSRAYAKAMIECGAAGSIINIASPAGLRAAPTMGPYGAAKAAVINFTWTLAVELAQYGIRANVVVPAFVTRPGMTWGGSPEEQAALAKKVVPMGRVTRAEDVAGAILCFASELTAYSTGQMIVCDGGRLLTNPIFA
jgi:NAD(P)-dependent dehydrogenase (short-subunit alcohol dehydrogenase family)